MKIIYLLGFMAGGAVLGSLLGYYGKCSSGACPLTANPYRGALWGLFLGTLFGLTFISGSPSVNAEESKNVYQIKNAEEFDAKIASGAVVAYFSAKWCAPCKALAPIYSKLADEYEGKAVFIKIDIDENAKIAEKFSIKSIPTLIFFKDAKEIGRLLGLLDEKKYIEEIEKTIK